MILRAQIFAGNINLLATEPPGGSFTLHPCDGVNIQVRIVAGAKPLPYEGDEDVLPVGGEYDEVYLNDVWVGNRSGAIQAYVQLVGYHNPTVEWD
jgi:hypothetical protein